MNKVDRYVVIARPSLNLLEEVVRNLITEGWIPQGGIMVVNSPTMFYQAMIKA
jgi:hypothetical protein